ncbi:glutathione S-transferase [Paraburkholderia sp. NMBU_R16]|uniref:glutathione S-transferase family protein n=1 Tax=Paraburkholderia sp. NMBU_R16 TaxID=2698676 RepID=UPI00156617F5|nr:glutathione S-transferase N-terminal domain-containing protein [Paraburkholderia sp. NMBU_R16]NRO97628.1 glutathione S-transferase [Paraburkholderia sp. NMBU_R16]
MNYRLYYSPGACSLAVHIALEEIGIPFERQEVSVARGETTQPDYLAVNPKARVPALAIAGETRVLTELPAILTFLARRHPEANLLPNENALDEARCHEWLAWLAGWVHGVGYGELWRPLRFVSDASLCETISAAGRRTIERSCVCIEAELADGRPWAVAHGYSIVDPFLLVLYRWGNRIGLPMRERYPAWTGVVQRVSTRPAVQRAMANEGVFLDR